MKIAFVVKYYETYIKHLEDVIPDIQSMTFKEIMKYVNEDYFMMYNSYLKYLNRMPDVECVLIIPNWKLLQDKWCQENNVEANGSEIAVNQILKFKPDILFFNSNFEYYSNIIPFVKTHVKKIVTWISCPLPPDLDLDGIDHIFTLFPPHYDYFLSIGKNCTLTTAGFDPEILNLLGEKKEKYEISFVGGIGQFHKKREDYLKYLIPKVNMKVWGYGFRSANFMKDIVKQILSRFIYLRAYQNSAWGIEMFKVLYHSKMTFNCHGDIAKEHAVNMRLFEATGMGTLLITEYSENIEKFFIPGKEIVCYTSKEDALEKIRYYSKNDSERKSIAKAGQKKVVENYSYSQLSLNMMNVFKKILGE